MPNKPAGLLLVAALLGALLLVNTPVSSATMAELQAADRLRINTWIEPAENIVARQQLKLQIEVATDSSFSGGTRIGHFEVSDAIVMQRETAALNSVREEAGKTWTVQQWTLEVYPQRGGEFEVPPVPLTLSILGEDFQPVTGRTSTRTLAFTAGLPETLADLQGWVATRRFEIDERFDKSMDELKPGDALLRSITMSADNLPAMMLPPVLTGGVPGIAAYAKSAQLSDKVNRGDYLAERRQQITYVIEKPGNYQLPEQIFHWWNLETRSVETIVLAALDLVVAGSPGQTLQERDMVLPGFAEKLKGLLPVAYRFAPWAMLTLLLLWLVRRRYVSRHTLKTNVIATPDERRLLKQARLACRQGNDAGALDFLYQWMRCYGLQADTIGMQVSELQDDQLQLSYDSLMRRLYTVDKSQPADSCKFIKQFTDAVKKHHKPLSPLDWHVELKLN